MNFKQECIQRYTMGVVSLKHVIVPDAERKVTAIIKACIKKEAGVW
jgi:tetrahydromethanopterin S-methyltransferase subunit A